VIKASRVYASRQNHPRAFAAKHTILTVWAASARSLIAIVGGSGILFLLAYLTYGRFLSNKVFGLDNGKKTPAVEINDENDFVSAKKGMLLGQHFSAIAVAGPVNGPILAGLMFGWVPALIWIIIGSIFVGSVHDMGSLLASVRNKARSISDVIRENVSKRAWVLFMVFIWIALVTSSLLSPTSPPAPSSG